MHPIPLWRTLAAILMLVNTFSITSAELEGNVSITRAKDAIQEQEKTFEYLSNQSTSQIGNEDVGVWMTKDLNGSNSLRVLERAKRQGILLLQIF